MSRLAISTVVTPDRFQYFIPPFVYCAKRAYPDAKVQVFVTGKIEKSCRHILKRIPYTGWELHENQFLNYPKNPYLTNALRLMIPESYHEDCDYLYIPDVDFLLFSQSPSHVSFYANIMNQTGLPYVAFRGPKKSFYRPEITGKAAWKGVFKRVVIGNAMFRIPDWYKVTKRARKFYNDCMKRDVPDKFDNHRPGTYREYDEVLMCRILRMSHLQRPAKTNAYCNNEWRNNIYRDIHIGDFKFDERYHNDKKMKELLHPRNAAAFRTLEQESVWKTVVDECCGKSEKIDKMFRRLRKYVRAN